MKKYSNILQSNDNWSIRGDGDNQTKQMKEKKTASELAFWIQMSQVEQPIDLDACLYFID